MRFGAGRNFVLLLAGINLFVIAIQLILATMGRGWNAEELMRALAVGLIYANVTSIPALWILPGIFERIAQRKFLLFTALIVCPLFFLLAGCLAAQALLCGLGVFTAQGFWLQYVRTLPAGLLGSLLFGIGAFFYASIEQRLHRTEEKLHEKEILEERAQKLAAEARLETLESRVHPHFLFNTLNSISALVAENPALAEKTIGRLAALLRSSLDNTAQPLIPLRKEVAITRDYFEIEKVRFGDGLRGRIDVAEELLDAKVPPFSIQSLVENAIKHGITPQRGGGDFQVSASAQKSDANLLIEVHDSGPGFNFAKIPSGHGLDNLTERLNALYGDKAYLKVLQRDGRCVVQMVVPQS